MTIDLFEAKNVPQVIDSIFAFSRHVVKHGFNGPQLGPKLADKHVVSFSDEQLNAGKNIPSQQMGFTGGANASGISYGGRRNVTNPNVGTGSNEGMSTLTSGYNGGANQSGMSYGGRRNIVDPKVGTGSNEGISQLTSGYNGGANQSGMSYGGRREIGGRDSGKN